MHIHAFYKELYFDSFALTIHFLRLLFHLLKFFGVCVTVKLQVMEEVGMEAVGVRKVETMVGCQPSLSQQLMSRPLTMHCVGWELWAAVLLVKRMCLINFHILR